jgi:hypothetical protein
VLSDEWVCRLLLNTNDEQQECKNLNNMMKRIIFCAIAYSMLISNIAQAQGLVYNWSQQFATTSMSYGGCGGLTAHQSNGNVLYLNGINSQLPSLDVDPTDGVFEVSSAGVNGQMYLVCYSSEGDFLWAKLLGTNGGYSTMTVDQQDNIYITGDFSSPFSITDGVTSYSFTCPVCDGGGSLNAGYVLKLDEQGGMLWCRKISTYGAVTTSAIISSDNQLCIAGNYAGYNTVPNDFDPGDAILDVNDGTNYLNIFVLKVNSETGENVDFLDVNLDGYIKVQSLVEDSQGRIWVSGFGQNAVDFDMSDSTFILNQQDPAADNFDFLACYTWQGELVHAIKFGEEISVGISERDGLRAVISNDRIFVLGFAGNMVGDLDSGDGTYPLSGSSTYLCAYDTDANFIWAHSFLFTNISDLGVSTTGNPVFCATFSNSIDVNPDDGTGNFSSGGNFDFFIASLNASDGSYDHGFQIGGAHYNGINDLNFGNNGQLSYCGCFQGTTDMFVGSGSDVFDAGDDYDINGYISTYNYYYVGMEEYNPVADLMQIWPNPATDHLRIKLMNDNERIEEIICFSSVGEIAQKYPNVRSNDTNIDLSDLSPGIYNVVVKTSGGDLQRKMVVY